MGKVKFAPGKRVLLLRNPHQEPTVEYLIGTVQVLGYLVPYVSFQRFWDLEGVQCLGKRVAWAEPCMILLDPDETPEQSAEAMRELNTITTPTKETV